MTDKVKEQELKDAEEIRAFESELDDIDIDDLMAQTETPKEEMPTSSTEMIQGTDECIVKDPVLLDLYDEILDNARKDRESIEELLVNFVDMVLNDGDSSSASKEAVVNLMKIKCDVSDKMSKVADLMTRIKLKERSTFAPYMRKDDGGGGEAPSNSYREMLKQVDMLTSQKRGK